MIKIDEYRGVKIKFQKETGDFYFLHGPFSSMAKTLKEIKDKIDNLIDGQDDLGFEPKEIVRIQFNSRQFFKILEKTAVSKIDNVVTFSDGNQSFAKNEGGANYFDASIKKKPEFEQLKALEQDFIECRTILRDENLRFNKLNDEIRLLRDSILKYEIIL